MATEKVSTTPATATQTNALRQLQAAIDAAWRVGNASEESRAMVYAAFHEHVDAHALAKTIPPVEFPQISSRDMLAPRTSVEAEATVEAVSKWARHYLPGHSLADAIEQIRALFVSAWTECDEGLGALRSFEQTVSERAPDVLVCRPSDGCYIDGAGNRINGLTTAMLMLSRWRAGGGACGNLRMWPRRGHPIAQLEAAQKKLATLRSAAGDFSESMDEANTSVRFLLAELSARLPEGSPERQLVAAAIAVSDHGAAAIDQFRADTELPDGMDDGDGSSARESTERELATA